MVPGQNENEKKQNKPKFTKVPGQNYSSKSLDFLAPVLTSI